MAPAKLRRGRFRGLILAHGTHGRHGRKTDDLISVYSVYSMGLSSLVAQGLHGVHAQGTESGYHLASAAFSVNARYTFSGVERTT